MSSESIKRLLIVGNPEEHHVGAHLLAAAKALGLETAFIDVRSAHSRNIWVNRFFHRVLKRRPARLSQFCRQVVERCREFKPEALLVTGISPPHAIALKEIGEMGTHRATFLTDDPWNPANGAGFFWAAVKEYDSVWSPRQANLEDLRRQGCRRVEYLPFGYNPALHFPEPPRTASERERFDCDLGLIGGADADRFPIARALVRTGLKVRLYGGNWGRDPELRGRWHGFVLGREWRMAVGGATVNICFGRKANRDGHAMRSLELPAAAACLVVEDTQEHRELYGPDGECVVYYQSLPGLVKQVQTLCRNPARAQQLGESVQRRICGIFHHTYTDRLQTILRPVLNA